MVDVIGRVKAWPKPGDDCLARSLELHCGGVAANCALALSRWGVDARLVGCVGRDLFGDYLLRSLKSAGVNVRGVQRTTHAMTGLLYVNVTADGQRTFFGSRGANCVAPRPAAGGLLPRSAVGAHLVGYNFLDAGPERMARQISQTIRARGGWVSLDVGAAPSQQVPRKILQACRNVDILFVNKGEAKALTGASRARKAFALLQEAGPREVVLKLDKRGCVVAQGGKLTLVPSFAVPAVDSTGAGDAFVAAFLQARLRGWTVTEAALTANAAGAAAASVVGAGENMPGILKVAHLLRTRRLDRSWDPVRLRVLKRLRKLL